ncbi:hypothetical protein GCM10023187_34590 [Nibrella viscosa]|uniref:Uncharacterized protein n=1 Tax=Nibrella viscosa TaxID=1084524 RepID=A0ABP8KMC9_9BACT
MPFFDFLRPKQNHPDQAFIRLMEQLQAVMFPDGKPQIQAEVATLQPRLRGHYTTQAFTGMYLHACARFFLLDDPADEETFRFSVMNRPAGQPAYPLPTSRDAAILYEFLNEKFHRQQYRAQHGDEALIGGALNAVLGINNGTTGEQLPDAYGAFGYDRTNPIPVKGIINSSVYLNRLRTPDGLPVAWQRLGSTHSPVSRHPIDTYRIEDLSGSELTVLYLSPYEQTTSHRAPAGFLMMS